MVFGGGTPFGCSWDELDLDRLRRFFDDQHDDEALTWEAKATDVRPRHILTAASAFGNSVLGGFLVIGAEFDKKTQSWSLPGWEFPDEPQVWIKNIITKIDGWPPFDTRPFPIGSAHVAVVTIRPSATPPVITPDGFVFERTANASSKVTSAEALARLFERGERARKGAELRSEGSANALLSRQESGFTEHAHFSIGLASTGNPTDISAALFSTSFADVFNDEIGRWVLRDPRLDLDQEVRQYAVLRRVRAEGGYAAALVKWDGSVAIAMHVSDWDDPVIRDLSSGMGWPQRAWKSGASLLKALGCYGPMFVTIATAAAIPVKRWTDTREPTADEIDSCAREFRRADGQPSWLD